MRTVYRYELRFGRFPITLPLMARPLRAAIQTRAPYAPAMWVEVDDERTETITRWFQITGTGHEVPRGAEHIDTFQDTTGLVWHLWEIPGGA